MVYGHSEWSAVLLSWFELLTSPPFAPFSSWEVFVVLSLSITSKLKKDTFQVFTINAVTAMMDSLIFEYEQVLQTDP